MSRQTGMSLEGALDILMKAKQDPPPLLTQEQIETFRQQCILEVHGSYLTLTVECGLPKVAFDQAFAAIEKPSDKSRKILLEYLEKDDGLRKVAQTFVPHYIAVLRYLLSERYQTLTQIQDQIGDAAHPFEPVIPPAPEPEPLDLVTPPSAWERLLADDPV